MNNIEINYYFKDNIEFFCWAIDFFGENIIYEGNTQYCLFAITNLSNIENEYQVDILILLLKLYLIFLLIMKILI